MGSFASQCTTAIPRRRNTLDSIAIPSAIKDIFPFP